MRSETKPRAIDYVVLGVAGEALHALSLALQPWKAVSEAKSAFRSLMAPKPTAERPSVYNFPSQNRIVIVTGVGTNIMEVATNRYSPRIEDITKNNSLVRRWPVTMETPNVG